MSGERERVGAGVGFAAAAVGRLWRQHYLAVAKPGSAWLSPQQREQVAAEAHGRGPGQRHWPCPDRGDRSGAELKSGVLGHPGV